MNGVCTLLQGDMMGRAQISLSGAAMRFKRVGCPGLGRETFACASMQGPSHRHTVLASGCVPPMRARVPVVQRGAQQYSGVRV